MKDITTQNIISPFIYESFKMYEYERMKKYGEKES